MRRNGRPCCWRGRQPDSRRNRAGFLSRRSPAAEADAYLATLRWARACWPKPSSKANDAILNYAEETQDHIRHGHHPGRRPLLKGRFSIANVGDSRIYLFREGQLLQLTEDHSLVMEQVRRGMITLEQAKRRPPRTSSPAPWAQMRAPCPTWANFLRRPGDILVLTTDGVLRHVEDEEIRSILCKSLAARRLQHPDRRRQRRRRRGQLDLRADPRAKRRWQGHAERQRRSSLGRGWSAKIYFGTPTGLSQTPAPSSAGAPATPLPPATSQRSTSWPSSLGFAPDGSTESRRRPAHVIVRAGIHHGSGSLEEGAAVEMAAAGLGRRAPGAG